MCDRIRRQPLTVAVRTPRNGMTSAIVPHSGDWIGRRRYADTSSARLRLEPQSYSAGDAVHVAPAAISETCLAQHHPKVKFGPNSTH